MSRSARRQPAQVMVLFALGLVGLLALMSLVLDGTTIYVQRRTTQNAADAAALAGTRMLTITKNSPDDAVAKEVCKYLQANAFGPVPTGSASLVDVNGNTLRPLKLTSGSGGACASTPDSTDLTDAGGVHVDASVSFNTYLLGVVERALRLAPQDTLTATSGATSRVWAFSLSGTQVAPFAVCGPHAPTDTDGTLTNLFLPDSGYRINPALYDTPTPTTIILEDSQINAGSSGWLHSYGPPACPDDNGSSWKGVIDPGTGPVTLPATLPTVNGNGQKEPDVTTPCTGQGDPTQNGVVCYLWTPVTDGTNNSKGYAHVVALACLKMVYVGDNPKWEGVLQKPNLCPSNPYSPTWTWTPGGAGADTRIALAT